MPKVSEEVCLELKSLWKGAVVHELKAFEYLVGSESFKGASKIMEQCLLQMKRLECSSVKLQEEIDWGVLGMADEVFVTLKEIYEVKDVSFMKDRSLMKKQIVEGQGYEMPQDSRLLSY